jgi:SAM-dependent methyltransferase
VSTTIANVYEDAERASSYAALEFPGTYYLAYRDLPAILAAQVRGRRAIDFGCGTGRSTRLLQRLGFQAVGVDISADMLRYARERDPKGDYRLLDTKGLEQLAPRAWDLVLSVFTFDNVPTREEKVAALRALAGRLEDDGRLVSLVSSPEVYTHEWASFTTKDFPENWSARSGDRVRIVMTDVADRRPVEDVLCPDEDYQRIYAEAGLEVVATYRPLGRADEPFAWVNETRIGPWVIYALKPTRRPERRSPCA